MPWLPLQTIYFTLTTLLKVVPPHQPEIEHHILSTQLSLCNCVIVILVNLQLLSNGLNTLHADMMNVQQQLQMKRTNPQDLFLQVMQVTVGPLTYNCIGAYYATAILQTGSSYREPIEERA